MPTQPACPQSGCQIAQNGRCLEGIDPPSQCPHLQRAQKLQPAPPRAQPEQSPPPAPTVAGHSLPSSKAMDLGQARGVTMAHPTRILVLAGESDSGKTTLLAAIYEQFQRGPFAGYLFAGSGCLHGMEERCHLARIACQQDEAQTERTHSNDLRFLHLRVRRQDLAAPAQDLLISDISGERLKQASRSREEAQRLPVLRRADHFILLIDGKRLGQLADRHKARRNALGYLRSFLDYEMLDADTRVHVLISKWDLLSEHGATADNLVNDIQNELDRSFRGRVHQLTFAQIAARPDTRKSRLTQAHGLADLFPAWVEEAHPRIAPPQQEWPRWIEPDDASEFDRYLRRRLPHLFAPEIPR